MVDLVTIDDVRAAARRLDGVIQPTPLERSRALTEEVGAEVLLKCENLQRAGSFKVRGAVNRIARLSAEERARGVVAASAGNHAQGVALAATSAGVEATVFMPREAPIPKIEATEAYGAEVRLEGASFDEALGASQAFANEHGKVFVHPFDHPDVIAGQGTIGLELAEQAPDIGTVVVPIGGGGLIAGVAVALKALRPSVRVVGVQASGSASFPAALAAGRADALPRVDTIADGIAVKRPGEITLAHVAALVDEVVTVDDGAIASAVVLLLERAKLVVEPAGAVAVAAIRSGAIDTLTGPVVALLSGGNIDPLLVRGLVTGGLAAEGRYLTFSTRIDDRPGSLVKLLETIAAERGNVVGVEHHRFEPRLRYGQVDVVVELETRGHDHIEHLTGVLRARGYPVRRL